MAELLGTKIDLTDKTIEAAAGRFFDPESSASTGFHSLSQSILVDCHHLLRDRRGILLQYGIGFDGSYIDYHDIQPSQPPSERAVTLTFDASEAATAAFGWQLEVGSLVHGRKVYKVFTDLYGEQAFGSRYRMNGEAVHVDSQLEDFTQVTGLITGIVTSDRFAARLVELSQKKDKAIEELGVFTMELVAKGYGTSYMNKLLDARQKGVDANSFGYAFEVRKP